MKKIDKVGETNINKNEQVMTIIEYRRCNDIDIQFEDGTIVKRKSYDNFKRGNIKNINLQNTKIIQNQNRIGETNIATNGQVMTIIKYQRCKDIDVQFEDRTIVKNKSYDNFLKGQIKNPNYIVSGISYNELFCLEQLKQFGFLKVERGELLELKNRELDLYNSKLKIGIEYDGGAYTKNRKYHTTEKDLKKDLLCEQAGITLYRIRESQLPKYNSSSIKYYLEDNRRGSQNLIDTISLIIKDINLRFNTNFKYNYKRKELNLNIYKKREKEVNIATNGQIITIIEYRGCEDIDVQFEDGTVVKNKSYYCFKKGEIKNPNYNNKLILKNNRTGETNIANNGQVMTIIKYRSSNDIDIQFEDGTIIKNKTYNCFKKGNIKNPNLQDKRIINRENETNIATNGQIMTIIKYRNNTDIDVQFEDGTIVKHTSYDWFLKKNTNKSYEYFKNKKNEIKNTNLQDIQIINRESETNIANNGQIMTIIKYRNNADIDIQFEDGTIVKHKSYQFFKRGEIKNPNLQDKRIINRENETNIAKNGQIITIIKNRNTDNIDIQFEDGTIVKHKSYSKFKLGNIKNPNYENI